MEIAMIAVYSGTAASVSDRSRLELPSPLEGEGSGVRGMSST
jgi:hypothetical protein